MIERNFNNRGKRNKAEETSYWFQVNAEMASQAAPLAFYNFHHLKRLPQGRG
jgi:hypothetical protein